MPLELQVNGAVSFRQLDPSLGPASGGKYFVRHAGCGPLTIDARGIRGRANWSANFVGGQPDPTLGTASHNRFTVPRPMNGCGIQVSCQAGNEWQQVEIWYVACSLALVRSGPPGAGDPNWPRVQNIYRERYVGGQDYTFPELGRIRFNYSFPDASGVRYADFVKLVATVTPANVPIGFFHARRIQSVEVQGFDANSRPLEGQRRPVVVMPRAGDNDSNMSVTSALTPTGQIFDYDIPGGVMRSFNLPGDRHVWNVTFEQAVGIGYTSLATAWTTLQTNARQLATLQYSVSYTATYRSPAGTMFGQVEVTPNS
jgi:hypothetical protein